MCFSVSQVMSASFSATRLHGPSRPWPAHVAQTVRAACAMNLESEALRELWAKAALERSSKAGPLLLATSSQLGPKYLDDRRGKDSPATKIRDSLQKPRFQSCGRAGTMHLDFRKLQHICWCRPKRRSRTATAAKALFERCAVSATSEQGTSAL